MALAVVAEKETTDKGRRKCGKRISGKERPLSADSRRSGREGEGALRQVAGTTSDDK